MSPVLGNGIALILVALLVYACARSLWKTHRAGGCGGNCASCGSCTCGKTGGTGKAHVSDEKLRDMQLELENMRSRQGQ